jgi:Fic family protein
MRRMVVSSKNKMYNKLWRDAMKHIHEHPQWPSFYWDKDLIGTFLRHVIRQQGRLMGHFECLSYMDQTRVLTQTYSLDVLSSSKMEGKVLDNQQVRLSVLRHLGKETQDLIFYNAESSVKMIMDVVQSYAEPLTKERLVSWHACLLKEGVWRTSTTSAPEPHKIDYELALFLSWLNGSSTMDPLIKTAVAHIWFLTISPFEDGNGAIARNLTNLLLARSEKSAQRCYSFTAQLIQEKAQYFSYIERTRDLDITDWISWFLGCLLRSIETALMKIKDIREISFMPLNPRQRHLIENGFKGKITTSSWAKIHQCSQDTAHRDILDLIDRGLLIKNREGGRSTSYDLK